MRAASGARSGVRATADEEPTLDYFMVGAPAEATLAEIARGVRVRWTIETGFKTAKGEVGLDHYEVRSWHGWYRHSTLALLAYAYLTVMRAQANGAEAQKGELRVPMTERLGSLRTFKQGHGLLCP